MAETPETPELTVLIYFASDNPLAPLIVSELKAIKDAGFQQHTNVVVYFDPMEKGVPTRLYDVNRKRKEHFQRVKTNPLAKDQIGDGKDPFVRKMFEDEIPERDPRKRVLKAKSDSNAKESLTSFVKLGTTEFSAPNYILILVGHGMVVGNDAFLPDDDPVSSIRLKDLEEILKEFKKGEETSLQLLGFHSCSMSSLEVAYQLKGLAKYLIATQGTTFVNSWHFRQMTKKTLNHVKKAKDTARSLAAQNGLSAEQALQALNNTRIDVEELVEKLYFLCMHNATDFIDAGYSADLVLCNLEPKKLVNLRKKIEALVELLVKHLEKPGPAKQPSLIEDLILLAHWESQSFYSENYTDLCDFVKCLRKRCIDAKTIGRQFGGEIGDSTLAKDLDDIEKACNVIIGSMAVVNHEDRLKRFDSVVIHAENSGAKYQYARGLSIYFPWHEPREENPTQVEVQTPNRQNKTMKGSTSILDTYQAYAFNMDANSKWVDFLRAYFDATLRPKRAVADSTTDMAGGDPMATQDLVSLASDGFKDGVELEQKRTPEEGPSCSCPTIKNHPPFSITPRAARGFGPTFTRDNDENGDGAQ